MRKQFNELYEKFHHEIFRFILYMVKDREQAEDLVQEVYIKVLDAYSRFRGQSSERTWIYSIARHVAIDWLRQQQRRKKKGLFQLSNEAEELLVKDDKPLPDEIIAQNETTQLLYQSLDECSVDQKSVIIMRFIEDFSISETAEILNWTESKVKTTQHRAIKRLKKVLESKNYDWIKKGVNE
jgi:RNA polymerase sigma-70 factor, ECF subfamily